MNRRMGAFLGVLVLLLAVVALLVVKTRYREPRGAAAGGAAGCGSDEGEEEDVVATLPDGVGDASEYDETPAQIIYDHLQDGKPCQRLVIEPLDRVASVEDKCSGGDVKVYDLDDATAAQVVQGYLALKDQECPPEECPVGQRIEVLLLDEQTRVLRYAPPLSSEVERLLDAHLKSGLADGDSPPGTPGPEKTPPQSVKLGPETGVVFALAKPQGEASPLKVDVICYESSKTVDLQAGAGPTLVDQKHLKLFRTPGGTVQKFDSLAEVPSMLPAATDRDMVHHADAGMGFVVENNVSSGHTKVFVKDAGEGFVTLDYVLLP